MPPPTCIEQLILDYDAAIAAARATLQAKLLAALAAGNLQMLIDALNEYIAAVKAAGRKLFEDMQNCPEWNMSKSSSDVINCGEA